MATVSLALSLLLLYCQLWFYTIVVASNNRPGMGEGADFNPKLPSPHSGETGAMKHAHSPAHCKPVACTVWLAWAARTPASEFQVSRCRPGPSLQQCVFWSIGTALLHLLVGWTPQRWVWHSPACSECGAGAQCWKCAGREVLHQGHTHCLSCSVYHRTWLAAASKDLSWSPVTEAMLTPRRSQDITKRTQGHAVWWPPYYLWTRSQ